MDGIGANALNAAQPNDLLGYTLANCFTEFYFGQEVIYFNEGLWKIGIVRTAVNVPKEELDRMLIHEQNRTGRSPRVSFETRVILGSLLRMRTSIHLFGETERFDCTQVLVKNEDQADSRRMFRTNNRGVLWYQTMAKLEYWFSIRQLTRNSAPLDSYSSAILVSSVVHCHFLLKLMFFLMVSRVPR